MHNFKSNPLALAALLVSFLFIAWIPGERNGMSGMLLIAGFGQDIGKHSWFCGQLYLAR